MTEPLDALRLPLSGSRLIEASAGTGKTWTIAALVLRLVLGHGGAMRPLLPAEILVMTFTRAATRELVDRIRSRLLEAAHCFRGDTEPLPGDSFMAGLLADHPAGPLRQAAAWRLALAAESMDEAAVETIDAWCQRMLHEHAFDSGSLFDEELNPNEQALVMEAAHDHWRTQVYPLAGAALEQALAVWRNVEALTDDVARLIEQPRPAGAGQGSLGALIERLGDEQRVALALLKAGWAARAAQMRHWLQQQIEASPCGFDKRLLKRVHFEAWLDALTAWADDPAALRPELKTGAQRLIPEGLRALMKPGFAPVLPTAFDHFGGLVQALDSVPSMATPLRLHAVACVAERLVELRRRAGTYGFADLLARFDHALDPVARGAAAMRLRALLLAQHPVALVDEFQDTSPVQARIFDRLYRIADNDPASALLLIGDPKQSIFAFRGADIDSYLQARRATAGRHHVLATNHRSSAAMVGAINQLFGQAEARAGAGAFMARRENGDNPLPFHALGAAGRPEAFVTARGAGPALSFELDAELLDARRSRERYAARFAERISLLLNDERAGFSAAGVFTRLRPADIAVLVRTGVEAAAVRRELRRRGIASVYLSDQDSVFDSAEARDLLHWLRAVAEPRDARLARAALATRTAGLSIDELRHLASSDEAFDARCEQLRLLHGVWQAQGVLAMLRQALHLFELPARWLGAAAGALNPKAGAEDGADGERRLTNVLHLAELLQAASAQLEGEQALIRWLASQRADPSAKGDEQIVRLESDADLVKVVTVHKAKGLEYPLVMLPFASSYRPVGKDRGRFVRLTDDAGQRVLCLDPDNAQIAAADRERQLEDLRLLYVALTRARHAVWVGLATLKIGSGKQCMWPASAIGYLLTGDAPVQPAAVGEAPEGALAGALATQLVAVLRPCLDIALVAATAPAAIGRTALRRRGALPPLPEPAPYAAAFDRRWSIGSFSALVRSLAAPLLPLSTPVTLLDDEVLPPAAAAGEADAGAAESLPLATVAPAASAGPPSISPWHAFPRGAVPGNFLHDQLEWLAGEGFALADAPDLAAQLARRTERLGWGHRAAEVEAWLAAMVSTPLPPLGASLENLGRVLPEMEFWLPSERLASADVDALCRAHLLSGRARPSLPERHWHGMLMGFADLVFEHSGRYWVLDYKSNHLGDRDADYSAAALEAAMAAHRYDVQAALYLLALHRLLRARLGRDYRPAEQLGGAVFFFLRGLRGPASGCYWVPPHGALLDGMDSLLAADAVAE